MKPSFPASTGGVAGGVSAGGVATGVSAGGVATGVSAGGVATGVSAGGVAGGVSAGGVAGGVSAGGVAGGVVDRAHVMQRRPRASAVVKELQTGRLTEAAAPRLHHVREDHLGVAAHVDHRDAGAVILVRLGEVGIVAVEGIAGADGVR